LFVQSFALQDFAGLKKLPFRSSSGRRVGIREGILREALGLRRDSEELAKFPLPRRYDCIEFVSLGLKQPR
jgi:hypothetical protein